MNSEGITLKQRFQDGIRHPLRAMGRFAVAYPQLLLLVVLVVGISIMRPSFFTGRNLVNILRQASVIGIVTCAVTVLIISGAMDLSVGSIVTLTAVVVVYAVSHGMYWWAAILVGLLVAVAAGAFNSVMINVFNANFVIVTLSTLTVYQGIALLIASGTYIIIPAGNPILFLGQGRVGGIPVPIIAFALVTVFLHLLLTRTRIGRGIYFVGVNSQAAALNGISARLYHGILYLVTGFFAGVGGIILSSRVGSTSTSIGKGFEFDAITAAVLGGVYLFGGRGTLPQAVLGVIIITMLANAQTMLGVSVYGQMIVKGVVLAAVVALQEVRNRRSGA